MKAAESQGQGCEQTAVGVENEAVKLVPVTESIRYRKRAQSAERQLESLSEELAEVRSQAAEMSRRLEQFQTERTLMQKLAAAGVVDLEAAVLLAKERLAEGRAADVDACVQQLRKEKRYLFDEASEAGALRRTSGAKGRLDGPQAVLERAAQKAAVSGSRVDLQEYMRLRRQYL